MAHDACQAGEVIHTQIGFWRFGHRPMIENEHLKPPKFIMLKTRWVKSGDLPYGNNTILFIGTSSINGLSMAKGSFPHQLLNWEAPNLHGDAHLGFLPPERVQVLLRVIDVGCKMGCLKMGAPKMVILCDSNGETYDQPCFFWGTLFPDKPTWSNDHLNLRRPVWFVIPSMIFLKPERSSLSSPSLEVGWRPCAPKPVAEDATPLPTSYCTN